MASKSALLWGKPCVFAIRFGISLLFSAMCVCVLNLAIYSIICYLYLKHNIVIMRVHVNFLLSVLHTDLLASVLARARNELGP